MHCRLLQQSPWCEEGGQSSSRWHGTDNQNAIYRIWIPWKDNFRCRCELYTRDVQTILQADEHTAVHNIILSWPQQWTKEGTHKVCEMYYQKFLDTNKDVSLTLLQIQSAPIGTWLPSPVMLLFNRPIKFLLPQLLMEAINIDNNDAQYKALKANQIKIC